MITNSIHHAFAATDQKHITITLALEAEHIHLIYRDNRCGVPADIRYKIFEPFFTTARRTGGSGLGLSIVYNLVTQKLGGLIELAEDQSNGAGFLIRLPVN